MDDGANSLVLRRALRLCKEGNRDEFKAIVDIFGQRLIKTAFLVTGDSGLAEDAVQETLVRAWTGIRRFCQNSAHDPVFSLEIDIQH